MKVPIRQDNWVFKDLKMGKSTSHPIFLALSELLCSKNLKIKKGTLKRFLEECDTIAPWFAISGSLTMPSWEKLGKDLDFAANQGTLKAGVRPVWRLVKSCLEDQKCSEAVENGQAALEMLQEERSEHTSTERESTKGKGVYPDLKGLDGTDTSDAEEGSKTEEEQEQRQVTSALKGLRLKEKRTDKGGPSRGISLLSATLPCPIMTRAVRALEPPVAPRFGDRSRLTCWWHFQCSLTHRGRGIMSP